MFDEEDKNRGQRGKNFALEIWKVSCAFTVETLLYRHSPKKAMFSSSFVFKLSCC